MVFCLWNGGLYLRGKFTFATHEFFNCWTPVQNCPYCEKWTLKSGVTWQMAKDWKSIYLHWTSIDYSNPVQFEDWLEQSKRSEGAIGSPGKKGRLKEGSKCYVLLTVRKWPRLIPLTSNIEEASSNNRKGCKCQNAKCRIQKRVPLN